MRQTRNLLLAFAIGNEKIAFLKKNMHKMATLWSDPKSEADLILHFWKTSSYIWIDIPKIPSLWKKIKIKKKITTTVSKGVLCVWSSSRIKEFFQTAVTDVGLVERKYCQDSTHYDFSGLVNLFLQIIFFFIRGLQSDTEFLDFSQPQLEESEYISHLISIKCSIPFKFS